MKQPDTHLSLKVHIADHGLSAELAIPAYFSREELNPQLCQTTLEDFGVEVTEEVMRAIEQLLSQAEDPTIEHRGMVARGLEAVDGIDGTLEWLVDQKPIEQSGEQRQNFYEQSSFTLVKPGQVLARITEPTPGQDGRDVRGTVLPARIGRPVDLSIDQTLLRDSQGQLLANEQGVLIRQHNSATIHKIIEVSEYVDFTTGNIDFDGDVLIRKGVRDCFVVRAGGNVEVCGLIEAATINCKGDLMARGGFAGRERGMARTGGNLVARYLDNIQGEIRGDLCVDREIINCEFLVHGHVRVERGAIIGGRYVVGGTIEAGTIGSAACVTTELVVGAAPKLNRLLESLRNLLHTTLGHRDQLLREKDQTRRNNPADAPRLTRISQDLNRCQALLNKGQAMMDEINRRATEQRTVGLQVNKMIYAGTILNICGQIFHLDRDLKGPLHLKRDGQGEIVYLRDGGGGGKLIEASKVQAA